MVKLILDRTRYTCLSLELFSESKTAGHFPPSSRVTGVRCFAAAVITIRPTLELPGYM